ncbi:uncharacterized [Tachysurus ichikawai]
MVDWEEEKERFQPVERENGAKTGRMILEDGFIQIGLSGSDPSAAPSSWKINDLPQELKSVSQERRGIWTSTEP